MSDSIKQLKDFTTKDIQKFDEMHKILTAFNNSTGTAHELPFPKYSRSEVAEYSGYRELLLTQESKDS